MVRVNLGRKLRAVLLVHNCKSAGSDVVILSTDSFLLIVIRALPPLLVANQAVGKTVDLPKYKVSSPLRQAIHISCD
jgi:hypothetical protein